METTALKPHEYKSSRYNLWQNNENSLYIINTFSKGIVKIEEAEKQYIEDILAAKATVESDTRFPDYFEILKNNGFMIPKEHDEISIMEYNYMQHHFSSEFLALTVLPTLLCNFDCPYCFEKVKNLSWDDERLAQMKLFAGNNFKHKKQIHMAMFGGEPLLQWKRFKSFLEYVIELKEEYGFEMSMTGATNAYFLDQDVIDDLFDRFCFKSLQFSIDGNRESHNSTRKLKNGKGTYDIVLHNLKLTLKKLKGTENKIALRVNLLNNSVKDAEELLKEFTKEEKDAMLIYFRPIFNSDHYNVKNCNRENLEEFYLMGNQMGFTFADSYGNTKYYYCEGDSGLNTFEINPDLSIWKCMSDAEYKPARLGRINQDGHIEYNQQVMADWAQKNPFMEKKCRECIFLPFCFGGCPAAYSKAKIRTCFYEKNFDLVKLLTQHKK